MTSIATNAVEDENLETWMRHRFAKDPWVVLGDGCWTLAFSLLEIQRGLSKLYWPWIICYFAKFSTIILVKKKNTLLFCFNFEQFLMDVCLGTFYWQDKETHFKSQSWWVDKSALIPILILLGSFPHNTLTALGIMCKLHLWCYPQHVRRVTPFLIQKKEHKTWTKYPSATFLCLLL